MQIIYLVIYKINKETSMIRNIATYNNLNDIINALSVNKFSEFTWVGKDYSKAQLIEDLKKIQASNEVINK